MTSPNFENIDLWLFDYFEGNLSVYQKELLENYIRNHPELDVDLDMWKMSTVGISDSFENDIQIKKKKESRGVYYLTSLAGVILILLIARVDHFQTLPQTNSGTLLSEELTQGKLQANTNTIEQGSFKTIPIQASKLSPKKESSYTQSPNLISKSRNDQLNTETAIAAQTKNGLNRVFVSDEIQDAKKDVSAEIVVSALPYQDIDVLTSPSFNLKLTNDIDEVKTKKGIALNGLRIGTKSLFNKIDRAFAKSIAFSNYRDHYYMIPGVSSYNAHLSSTGSVSQTRFFSTSRVRWFNTGAQKLSQEFSLDGYVRSLRSGMGAQLNYDTYADGTIQDWNASLTFSPKIALSRNISLEPVAKLKIGNKILNSEKATNNSVSLFNEASPQTFSFDTAQAIGRKLLYRDLDAGFTLNTKVFYLGFQAENILNHLENIYQNEQNTGYRTPTTYSVMAGTQYMSRNEKVSFHPYLYMRSNEDLTSYYAGFSFDLDKLFIGASYGSAEQYSGSLGLSLDKFALLVQTTRAFQPYLEQNLFTHQLTLRINSPMSKKTRRYITL